MSANLRTAVLLIDPYNDFLHPDGNLTHRLRTSLDENNTLSHLENLVAAARSHKLPIFYGLHQQWQAGTFHDWRHMSGGNKRQSETHFFAKDSFGAQIFEGLGPNSANGDVVVSHHWNSNAFWNTDLDHQLRQREITHLILAGLTANTCLESTARHAFECGYHITLLYAKTAQEHLLRFALGEANSNRTDATAAFNKPLMNAARDLIYPLIADEVSSTDDWINKLGSSNSSL